MYVSIMEALTGGRWDQMGWNHTDLAIIGRCGIVRTFEWRIHSCNSQSKNEMDNYKSGFFFLHSPCYVEKPASITFFQSSPESSQETLTVFCSQIFWLQCAICDHLFCSRSLWQWQWTKKQLFQKCTLEVFLPPYCNCWAKCTATCKGQWHLNQTS